MAVDRTALTDCGNGIWRTAGACIIDRTGRKRLPIGDDGFERAISGSVVIDKTMLIADVLDSGYTATLFCRPRRFGKTLNLTMMQSFFEIPPDGHSRAPLFEGTDIWRASEGSYQQYQGAYPVIALSLRTAKGLTWQQTYDALKQTIIMEYERHRYLMESSMLSINEKAFFNAITSGQADSGAFAASLERLAGMLKAHHHSPVVVLIDEYDAPVMASHSAPNGGYYTEAVTFLKTWLTGTLKDSGKALAFACLTGVQRISKESIFSDLNNLAVNTALSNEFDERYGFTEHEVQALATYLGHPDCMAQARQWYDGYRFGSIDVYNPWSMLNYFKQGCTPDVYWGNTSGNSVIGELVHGADTDTLSKIYGLMKPNGMVAAPLDLGIVFPDIGARSEAIWSMLYLAGYLTTEDTAAPGMTTIARRLHIPNLEIASLYHAEIIDRFASEAGGNNRLESFQTALRNGDERALSQIITAILRDGAPIVD